MLTQQLIICPFLGKCRKAEDEDGVGRVKSKGKIKVAAATTTTSSPSYSDAFAKQLKKQHQQFDAIMGKVQAMVTTLQSHNTQTTSSFCQGNPLFGMRGRGRMPFHNNGGRGSLEVDAFLHMVDGGAASTTEAQLPTKHFTSPTGAGEC